MVLSPIVEESQRPPPREAHAGGGSANQRQKKGLLISTIVNAHGQSCRGSLFACSALNLMEERRADGGWS